MVQKRFSFKELMFKKSVTIYSFTVKVNKPKNKIKEVVRWLTYPSEEALVILWSLMEGLTWILTLSVQESNFLGFVQGGECNRGSYWLKNWKCTMGLQLQCL